MKEKGIILHAKHAFMPNSLGYCGPDDRGVILQHLEESKGGEDLTSTLKEFEAAYPFLRLIARATGRDAFDYEVPEAYWIGNSLLDRVPVPDFHSFSHRELIGRDEKEVKRVFKTVGTAARPHHTFYVMNTYASSSVSDGPSLSNANVKKIAQMIDSCRVSWGEVKGVGTKTLQVEYRPMVLEDDRLALSKPKLKKVSYNREVTPFGAVKKGDIVSLHWDYACEVLNRRQLFNIRKYTDFDIEAANKLLAAPNRSSS
ncbi:MAG: DUF6390 family protein [Nitrososphaerales archaeon]